jgi:hypothetical protein
MRRVDRTPAEEPSPTPSTASADFSDRSSLTQRNWLILLTVYMLALVGLGVAVEPRPELWAGLVRILQSPGVLVSDYAQIGGLGAAMVNAGLVGLAGLLLVQSSGVLLSGPTIAAVFTMAGFGLFGKNVWSIWPIILGVALFGRVARRSFKSYILVAMFGTALAPLVTQVAFGFGLRPVPGLIVGTIAGLVTGFVLPALAVYMLRLHQGFSLYNVGLTCGFLGLVIIALLESVGLEVALASHWSEQHTHILNVYLLIYVVSMLTVGLYLTRGRPRIRSLLREAGTLPSDFVESHGAGTSLVNMGLVGLIGWCYILLAGGVFNGPTVGAVLTMVGFAAFGKHVANVLPVMAGVYIGGWLSVWQPGQAGPLLAALFGTTLAPLSGRFGPLAGLLSGLIHLTMVMRTAPWHAGLNLYNNGLAGGLTATAIVGVIDWWSSWREEHRAGR